MLKSKFGKFAVLASIGLALTACGNEEEILRISAEMKLTEAEITGFRVCERAMRDLKKPIFSMAGKYMTMNFVPLEVCACSSRSLAYNLDPETMKHAYPTFMQYASNKLKKRISSINEEYVLEGVDHETIIKVLYDEFAVCTKTYQTTHVEESKDLLSEIVQPVKQEKKIKKKKKRDENASSDPEKQASASP